MTTLGILAVKYIRGFPGAWLVRHDELAEWIKRNKIAEWTNEQRFFSGN
jgi:hypothetical protein